MLGLSNDVRIKVLGEKDCVQTISVEWPVTRVREEVDKALQSIHAKARLPGFRQGRAPMDLIRQNYLGTAAAQAQDDMVREGVLEAIRSKKIEALQPPVVTDMQFAPDKPFLFSFTIEVLPKFKLAAYKGLKLTRQAKSVTNDDVDRALQKLADSHARLIEAPEEALGPEHYGVISYEGFLDGKPLEGGKADNFLLNMSAPQAITGLVEGLTGARGGEEREVTVTFPQDAASPDLAGKSALFKVRISAVKKKKVPQLDDDFSKDVGSTSLNALRQSLLDHLEEEAKKAVRQSLESQIAEALLASHVFTVPPGHLAAREKSVESRFERRMEEQGLPEAERPKMLEQMRPDIRSRAERDVRLAYILNAIGAEEKIDVEEAEVEEKVRSIIQQAPEAEREKVAKILDAEFQGQMRADMRDAKLFDWLLDNAKIKEG